MSNMRDTGDSQHAPEETPEPVNTSAETNLLHPEDFYMEGPYMVFTEAYHLRRGYCCNSSCRHCPYK
jgi:hypothetical protein